METNRLILRPLELADAEQVQLLFPRWEIVRYLGNVTWPYPPDGALPAVERGEEWHWTLRLRHSPDRVVGGINLMKNEHQNRAFWLALPWHGQGLMSEASEVVTDYWFDVLGGKTMRIPKAAPNLASRRISQKQGMRVIATEERDYIGGRFLTEIWEITADEWRARQGS